MTYRTIAVHVNNSRHMLERVRLAAQIAADNEAHLVGVATTGVPESFYMGSLTGEGAVAFNSYLDFMKEHAATKLAAFESAAAKAGLPSFEKSTIEDEAGVAMCLQGRYSDLLIVGQADPDEDLAPERDDVPEYVVLNSGRPVLVIPYADTFQTVAQRIVIAWNGSIEAARTITAALPFLRKAKLVQVAVFDPVVGPSAHGEQPGADMALYLARHGVKVDVSQQRTGGEIDVGNALLSHASDFGADMIVMGGYGHSRFREILLGGVTRTVLQSMTVPVLMSH